jgi:carbohydrate-selective porin OprB
VRVGSFQMPRQANGNQFDADLRRARGDNAELTLAPGAGAADTHWPTIRLLGFVNHARMGNYAAALAHAAAVDSVPDIVADDQPGRRKLGWGVNLEQPLTDAGETGGFLRVGGNDGANESFAFTEVDRHLSAGLQVSGAHWRRPDDRAAVAFVRHGIVPAHRAYLAAGGVGFLLGDGRLTYGPEEIGEMYYRLQAGPYLQVSPDVQAVAHPGYNRDRGPAVVLSLRVNLRY